MKIYNGGTPINKIYFGSTEINRVYHGSTLVWQKPAAGGITVEQVAEVVNSSLGSPYTGSSFTVGSAANRVLVAVVHGYRATNGGPITVTDINFGGVAMTAAVAPNASSGRRQYGAVYYLINPASGAGTFSMTITEAHRGMSVTLYELSGVDQSVPFVAATTDLVLASQTSKSLTQTVAQDGNILISGVQVDAGNIGGEITHSANITAGTVGQTGTSGTSDVSYGNGYEIVSPVAASTHQWNWTTADVCSAQVVEFKKA